MNDKPRPHFIFVDIETTGLHRDCEILEVAAIYTDANLTTLDTFEWRNANPPNFDHMTWEPAALQMHHAWVRNIDDGRYSLGLDMGTWLLNTIRPDQPTHLAGSSVHFDRKFLEPHVGAAFQLLHHRHLDVSSLLLVLQMLGHPVPDFGPSPHRAMADCKRTIEKLQHFLKFMPLKTVEDPWARPRCI